MRRGPQYLQEKVDLIFWEIAGTEGIYRLLLIEPGEMGSRAIVHPNEGYRYQSTFHRSAAATA